MGELYFLANSRSPEQARTMEVLEKYNICVFCPEHVGKQIIIHQTDLWNIIENQYSYSGSEVHLLLTPHEHVPDILDLSEESRKDFWEALHWIRSNYKMTHYGIGSRNGDSQFSGSTVRHVHIHMIVPRLDSAVKFSFGN